MLCARTRMYLNLMRLTATTQQFLVLHCHQVAALQRYTIIP